MYVVYHVTASFTVTATTVTPLLRDLLYSSINLSLYQSFAPHLLCILHLIQLYLQVEEVEAGVEGVEGVGPTRARVAQQGPTAIPPVLDSLPLDPSKGDRRGRCGGVYQHTTQQ